MNYDLQDIDVRMLRGVFQRDIHTIEEKTFAKSVDAFVKRVQAARSVVVNKREGGLDERFDRVNAGFGRKDSTSISTNRTGIEDDFK